MFACLRIPDFHLAAALRRMDQPPPAPRAAVFSRGRHSVVAAADEVARRSGVATGMETARAMARCPGLALLPVDPAAEGAATSWLVALASSASPRIEVATDRVTVDLAGAGDPSAVGSRLASAAGSENVCIGVSDTPERAWWASLRASPLLVAVGDEELFGGFAPTAPPLPGEVAARLREWGLRDLLAFVRLPGASVARRLGPEGADLWREMKGERTRPLQTTGEPVRFRSAMDMEQPVETLEQALFVIRRLLDEVCAALDAAVRVAAVLRLRWATTDGSEGGDDFTVSEPTSRPTVLFSLLEGVLSTMRTEAPISFLQVEAIPGDPRESQPDLFQPAARDPLRFREVVGRVGGLLGEGNFGTPVRLPTCHPDGFRVEPPVASFAVEEGPAPFGARFGPALRRFRPSRPVEVRVRDGQPVHCVSEEGRGPVLSCRGPFRLSGDWWDPALRWSREEWDVEWPRRGSFRRLIRFRGGRWEWDGIYD